MGARVLRSLLPFAREGGLADYIVVPYDRMLPIAPELDDDKAAALPVAGGSALQALSDEARVVAGQRVLIIGAAGGVGHFAVQIAQRLGAHVGAVCCAGHAAFVRGIGPGPGLRVAPAASPAPRPSPAPPAPAGTPPAPRGGPHPAGGWAVRNG